MTGSRLLDSSVIISEVRAARSEAALLYAMDGAQTSAIAWGECMVGQHLSQQAKREARGLKSIAKLGIVLAATSTTADIYGRIYAYLRRAGTPIPTNDIWIAACALEHDLPLDTTDAHFALVPGLRLV